MKNQQRQIFCKDCIHAMLILLWNKQYILEHWNYFVFQWFYGIKLNYSLKLNETQYNDIIFFTQILNE